MNWNEELRIVAENVIASPRLTAATATATTTLSAYSLYEAFQSTLSIAGIIVGITATLLLCRLHWIKYKNEAITNKILMAQFEAMGVEPITEKIP